MGRAVSPSRSWKASKRTYRILKRAMESCPDEGIEKDGMSSNDSVDYETRVEMEDADDEEISLKFNLEFDHNHKLLTVQTGVAAAYFLTASFINCFFQVLTEHKVANTMGDGKGNIIDLGHRISAGFFGGGATLSTKWADALMMGAFGVAIVRFSFSKCRNAVLRRFLLVMGTMYLLRGPALYMTILPNVEDAGSCAYILSDSLIADTLSVWTMQTKTCADQFFSGHTGTITTSILFITKHTHMASFAFLGAAPIRLAVFMAVMIATWALGIAGMIAIIFSRLHYSIDVYIGFIITFFLFSWYYDVMHLAKRGRVFHQDHLTLSQRIIFWFESIRIVGTVVEHSK